MQNWSDWTDCNAHCDQIGIQYRFRNKIQDFSQSLCNETTFESKNCTKQCFCNFTTWSDWSECSNSCGSGFSIRNRKILSENKACNDSTEETKLCYNGCCPVDGKWSPWGQWSACSASCNSGIRKRSRACDSPKPDCKGLPCPGNDTDIEPCNVQPCSNLNF